MKILQNVGAVALSLAVLAASPTAKNSQTHSTSDVSKAQGTIGTPGVAIPESDAGPAPSASRSAATYQIPWQSINAGGAPGASANYQINASVGQSAIGFSTSASYQHGAGYWYGGAGATSCACPFQADLDGSNTINATDLTIVINVIFFGGADIMDPGCPVTRSDFNNNGTVNAVDLTLLINHVFFGEPGPCDPCNPVQSTCA